VSLTRYPAGVNPTRALTRLVLVALATLTLLSPLSPASADVPVGWSDPANVPLMHSLLIFVFLPLAMFLLLLAAIYLPPVVRGESVAPAGTRTEDQWLGGRRDTKELEAPDAARDDAGGAGGTW
jgi:hypothetical protein